MMILKLFILIFIMFQIKQMESFNFSRMVSGIGSYVGSAAHHAKCSVTECCGEKYIIGDTIKLKDLLEERLYGQELVKEVVMNAIKAHWNNPNNKKALTMSFHGSPGIGKNYVSQMIVESLYKLGAQSKYVHQFQGRIHFPMEEHVEKYREDLYNWIKGNISECEQQLFIFDEIDKMPSGVLNGIKPVIDYHDTVEKLNYKKSIFIFLSNTGSSLINDHYLNMWKSGVKRNDIKLNDFEKLIAQGSFNQKGGFHHSDTIKSNLIDHYIPFLPLEIDHIKSCIYTEFALRGKKHIKDEHMKEILDHVEWTPSPEHIFAKTGCKRLSQKVAMIIQKHYHSTINQEL